MVQVRGTNSCYQPWLALCRSCAKARDPHRIHLIEKLLAVPAPTGWVPPLTETFPAIASLRKRPHIDLELARLFETEDKAWHARLHCVRWFSAARQRGSFGITCRRRRIAGPRSLNRLVPARSDIHGRAAACLRNVRARMSCFTASEKGSLV